jgi:23S rRNA pseudouridine1911/1915/1917 synthase
MPESPEIIVATGHAGERLDRYLRRQLPNVSRATLAEAIAARSVRVNGRRATKGQRVQVGDRIETELLHCGPGPAPDPELPLRILYEDQWLVAVDKPAGVPSHALRCGERSTVASALLARYPEMASVGYRPLEPGLLHRLDTETSGVLIASRDLATFEKLRAAHIRGEIRKRYLALCSGHVQPRLEAAYLRADQRRVRVQHEPLLRGKAIETEIVSASPHGAFSLVCVQLAMASRHQIRAHLAALGHPIAADSLYGGSPLPGLRRHFLHASEVSLQHPALNERLELRAELPQDLAAVLGTLDSG